MTDPTVIVVGLDGAHFELIDRWIEDGTLDSIGSLVNAGVASDMCSCLPPVTSPNWKCYSSGQNPGKLGIYWWENIDVERRAVYYPEERKNRPNEIWDHLGDAGYSVCSVNTPLTHPPKEVDGALITGGPDAAATGYTYPEDLEQQLRSDHDYSVHPETSVANDREQAAAEIHDLIAKRFKVGLDLIEDDDFDFVQITTFYINVLQHHFWDDWETKRGWEIIDEYIRQIRSEYPESNVILMSDHGANKLDTIFNVNTWLAENSYLSYEWQYRLQSALADLGVTKNNVRAVTDALRITPLVKRFTPSTAMDTVPSDTAELNKEAKTDSVDWERSRAIASGQGPVYVLNDAVTSKLREQLTGITVNGKMLFDDVYERDEIYHGEFVDEAPRLIVDQAPSVHVRGSIGRKKVFDEPSSSGWRAENKKTGLFVADGPDIAGSVSESLSILDLAPTILSLFGVDPPAEMDGRVRAEILDTAE